MHLLIQYILTPHRPLPDAAPYIAEGGPPYGDGNAFAQFMALRDSRSENAPVPAAAAVFQQLREYGVHHNPGMAVERTAGLFQTPRGKSRSFESAMMYLFSDAPPMLDEMGDYEIRPHNQQQ